MTVVAETVRRSSQWMTATAPPVVMVFYGSLMILHHVQADRNESFKDTPPSAETPLDTTSIATSLQTAWQRLQAGPLGWSTLDIILFGCLILLAFDCLDYITRNLGRWTHQKLIPVRGKHLDEFSPSDVLFVGLNKAATAPFVYFFMRYAYFEENVVWSAREISVQNTLLPLPLLFLVFDFFYTIIHWFLHVKAIYGFIHKHHHHQKAPRQRSSVVCVLDASHGAWLCLDSPLACQFLCNSRANVDAVNVHPIEFFLGEYDHLLSLFLCCRVIPIHIVSALVFLTVGGVLAGLNHTRFDFSFRVFGYTVYDSKVHDVHHRIPQSNYGQYTMFWDHLFGSFRPYDENDRINPKAQLDPKTGKSLEYMEAKKLATKLQ